MTHQAVMRLRLALIIGALAAVYLLALTASTRFGLSQGLAELSGSAGNLHSSISYTADLPLVLGVVDQASLPVTLSVVAPRATPVPARQQPAKQPTQQQAQQQPAPAPASTGKHH